jgi:glutaredoxin/glutathione-dependent peroxiredoxin
MTDVIKEGALIPDMDLKAIVKEEIKDIKLSQLFADHSLMHPKDKKIVLFSVPGAFTPTCSAKHLPGYLTYAQAFKEKKVDQIVCLSVNDPFVMKAWCDVNKANNDIIFLADGNATFSEALGLTFDGGMYSLGIRGQRFAMILNGLKVEKLFIEKPGVFDVSSAEKVLAYLSKN